MWQKTILTISFIFIYLHHSAQTGNVSGQITTSDGQPAELVNVTVKGTSKAASADARGNYHLKNIPAGTCTIIASFIGLETREQAVDIKAGETSTVDFTLNENAELLQEVVIAGHKNPYNRNKASSSLRLNTPLIEVPQNIQIISPESIRDQQVISMSDGVIRNVSGATRVEHWGDLYANITMRGTQVQAFRNGFNIVNSFWGPLTEDMSFVEQIEFVKGPAGFMLASGDPSGLYNVVTKKPGGQTRGEASLTLGDFGLFRSTLDLDGKLSANGKLLYRLNLAAQNKKSHRANEFNNRYVFAPVISYRLDDRTLLTLEYTYQNARMSNVGSYYIFSADGFATLPRNFTMLPAGMPPTIIHDHSFFAKAEHSLSANWKLTGQLGRFAYQQDGSSMWPTLVNPDGTIQRAVNSWEASSTMTMGQIFLNGEFKSGPVRHRILAGLDMANKEYFADWGQAHVLDTAGALFNVHAPGNGTPVNGYPQFNYTSPLEQRAVATGGTMDQSFTAGYIQDELGFFDNRIRLTLAGRYTGIRQSEWGATPKTAERFTPRAGLSASLSKATAVYALYDQAFIPQAGKLSNGGTVKPITGENTELGIKRDWFGGRWNTTASIYRITKNNELVADPGAPPASGLSMVMGQKISEGIEFDLRGRIIKGLSIIANYAFTDSRISRVAEGITDMKEGDIVPGYARHTINGWLSYTIRENALRGLGFNAGITWLGDRHTYWDPSPDPTKNLPDYMKMDGGIFYEKEKIRITMNVFNVLNDYLYSGSYYKWLNAYNWQSEPGRHFRLSINYKF